MYKAVGFFLVVVFGQVLQRVGALAEEARPVSPPTGVKEATEAPEGCHIRLSLGWSATQDIHLKTDRIIGPDFNLHLEEDVIYGFIQGRSTRFRVAGDEISGTVSGQDAMLHVTKTGAATEVKGLMGGRRVAAKLTSEKISVSAGSAALALTRKADNTFRGHIGTGSNIGPADLTTLGCDVTSVQNRPELIVVLFMWWFGPPNENPP